MRSVIGLKNMIMFSAVLLTIGSVSAQQAFAGGENPAIEVEKAPHAPIFAVGDTIPVSANVTNTGDVLLAGLVVVDTEVGILSCGAISLNPGVSTTCTGNFTAVSSGTNTVTVVAQSSSEPVGDEDSQPFVVDNPSILVAKAPHANVFAVGDTIPVSALVTNTGNLELTNVQATDSEAGVLSCGAISLAPGASTTCTGNFTAVSSGTNIVTATGDSPLKTVNDNDSQPFVVEDPPSIPIGGTVGSMSTTSLLVAGAQANMGLWSLALVGMVAAGAAITYKLKSKKTKE